MTNILSSGQPDEYFGTIRISFDPASEKVPTRPVETTRLFRVEPADPVSSKRIVACVGGVGNDILGIKKCQTRTVAGSASNNSRLTMFNRNNRQPASTSVACPGNEKLLGCFGFKNPVFPQADIAGAIATFATTQSLVNLPQGKPGSPGGIVPAVAQGGLCSASEADSIIMICCE